MVVVLTTSNVLFVRFSLKKKKLLSLSLSSLSTVPRGQRPPHRRRLPGLRLREARRRGGLPGEAARESDLPRGGRRRLDAFGLFGRRGGRGGPSWREPSSSSAAAAAAAVSSRAGASAAAAADAAAAGAAVLPAAAAGRGASSSSSSAAAAAASSAVLKKRERRESLCLALSLSLSFSIFLSWSFQFSIVLSLRGGEIVTKTRKEGRNEKDEKGERQMSERARRKITFFISARLRRARGRSQREKKRGSLSLSLSHPPPFTLSLFSLVGPIEQGLASRVVQRTKKETKRTRFFL